MTAHPTVFAFADSTDLILEIPTSTPVPLETQLFSHPYSRYQAELNQLCLMAVLPWLEEDFTTKAKVWPSTTDPASFWELVNGSAVTVDASRFILVPSENIDDDELRIPQEWVDLPTWAGDYYIAVAVAADLGYVRVWGYCTHTQLKHKGKYDPGDRTYCLDGNDLIDDMSVLSVAWELCPGEAIRASSAPLSTISPAEAGNLITRLGNPNIIDPRLTIPFELWGGLIEHGGWRKSLSERRLGLPEQRSVLKWLQSSVSEVAAAIGWERLNLQLTTAGAKSGENTQIDATFSRSLTIAGQLYYLLIIPQGEPDLPYWRFELRNTTVGAAVPGGFKLRLLTEDLQSFPNNEDIATTAVEKLYVEVTLEAGEGVVWEIEPLPENYDREILRF